MKAIEQRQIYTDDKLKGLRGKLGRGTELAASVACVCMTGSYGRREAGEHSDLDLFIVGLDKHAEHQLRDDENPYTVILESQMSRLDEICLKAELIHSAKAIGIREFDGDGKYMAHYSVSDLVGRLGQSDDDVSNALTSRLLLLLEGRPLIGEEVFASAVDTIIRSYWRDFPGRERNFAPAFMSNDILRLWRTFCVNYEARTTVASEDKKLKRRVKNYKLKFSRLLTCYSALLSMLHTFDQSDTVTPDDMKTICSMSPLDRIFKLHAASSISAARPFIDQIVSGYDKFLTVTNAAEGSLIDIFSNDQRLSALLDDSYDFADSIFKAVNIVGNGSKLHRMVVV